MGARRRRRRAHPCLTLTLTLTLTLAPGWRRASTLDLTLTLTLTLALALILTPTCDLQEASFDPATFDAAFPSLGGGRPPPKLLAHCLPACFTEGLLARDRRDR